jgi:hypothetical protein
MLSSREEIVTAPGAYCAHISARNRRALEYHTPLIENTQAHEDDIAEDEIPQARLNPLSTLLDASSFAFSSTRNQRRAGAGMRTNGSSRAL